MCDWQGCRSLGHRRLHLQVAPATLSMQVVPMQELWPGIGRSCDRTSSCCQFLWQNTTSEQQSNNCRPTRSVFWYREYIAKEWSETWPCYDIMIVLTFCSQAVLDGLPSRLLTASPSQTCLPYFNEDLLSCEYRVMMYRIKKTITGISHRLCHLRFHCPDLHPFSLERLKQHKQMWKLDDCMSKAELEYGSALWCRFHRANDF